MLRLVKFPDGRYGVKTKGDAFLDDIGQTWGSVGFVNAKCKFDTLEEAIKIRDNNSLDHVEVDDAGDVIVVVEKKRWWQR